MVKWFLSHSLEVPIVAIPSWTRSPWCPKKVVYCWGMRVLMGGVGSEGRGDELLKGGSYPSAHCASDILLVLRQMAFTWGEKMPGCPNPIISWKNFRADLLGFRPKFLRYRPWSILLAARHKKNMAKISFDQISSLLHKLAILARIFTVAYNRQRWLHIMVALWVEKFILATWTHYSFLCIMIDWNDTDLLYWLLLLAKGNWGYFLENGTKDQGV